MCCPAVMAVRTFFSTFRSCHPACVRACMRLFMYVRMLSAVQLYGKVVPDTVKNFVALLTGKNSAEVSYRGTEAYRVLDGLNIQVRVRREPAQEVIFQKYKCLATPFDSRTGLPPHDSICSFRHGAIVCSNPRGDICQLIFIDQSKPKYCKDRESRVKYF